jgi:mRNA interferase MazF
MRAPLGVPGPRPDPRVLHPPARGESSEVTIVADDRNGLTADSAGQCQHVRAIAAGRVGETIGNIGPLALAQLRDTLAVLLDL